MADLLQDTVAANLSLRNTKYVIKRSRKENKIYLENIKNKKIVVIDKYHRCYDSKSKINTMLCSSPYIDLYGDFNNDGKIDFMYSQGLDKGSGTTIFISNPENDKYTEIELPYGGC
jgi:hypothetical protein